MYDDIRTSAAPAVELTDFLETTYEAGAILGKWDRAALERPGENRATIGG
jgi:hypothetical protein